MSTVKNILKSRILKSQIEEYLADRLRDANFAGVEINFTAIGTRVTIYAMRPGRVIGTKGRIVKEITRTLEERFKIENPEVSVAEVEVPELNPHIMAQRIASAVERGVRFRRASFWALDRIMQAGARGVEIQIAGKTRSARSRSEKFRAGFMPKCGDTASKQVKPGKASVQLKTGIFGVRVFIYPPEAPLPDAVEVLPPPEEVEAVEEKAAEEKPVEEEVVEVAVADETRDEGAKGEVQ